MMFCVSRKGTRSGVSSVLPCEELTKYHLTDDDEARLLEEAVEVDMHDVARVHIE